MNTAQIKDFFSRDWSDDEKGAVLVSSAQAYMRLMKEIYKKHNEELAELFAAIEDIDLTKRHIDEDVKLAEVRSNLNDAK